MILGTARTLQARLGVVLPPLAVGVILLATWEVVCRVLAIHPFLLPAPTIIGATLIADISGLMWASRPAPAWIG